jgi:hypothetical protein
MTTKIDPVDRVHVIPNEGRRGNAGPRADANDFNFHQGFSTLATHTQIKHMKTKYLSVAGLLVAFLFSATSTLFPSESSCMNWDARGFWKLNAQTSTVEMHLDQSGHTITGRASCNGDGGNVVGTIGGASLNFLITWSKGSTSSYTGSIVPDGRINGTWFPGAYNGTKYTWSGDRAMTCGDPLYNPIHRLKIVPGPTPSPAKVIHVTGHAKPPATPTPVGVLPGSTTGAQGGFVEMIPTTSEPQARTPLIKAHPRNDGTSTLIWDAGNDHPAAEVWVKVNGHEKKLFAQANKGRREVTVQPGKNYLYILTDSGQNLATVIVQSDQQEPMRHPHRDRKGNRQRQDDTEN